MKRLLFVFVLLLPYPGWAQQAPLRAGEVAAIASQHPETFQGPEDQADSRKIILLHTIVRALNQQDGGLWGELLKTDQQGRIPADIIVWRPTMEHFDVLSDGGPMWKPNGVVSNGRWIWLAVDGGSIPPPQPPPLVPTPAPAPSASVDYALIRSFVENAKAELYTQSERMFADGLVRSGQLGVQIAGVDARLQQHDDNPGYFVRVFGNRYVQLALAGVGAWLGAQQVAKP